MNQKNPARSRNGRGGVSLGLFHVVTIIIFAVLALMLLLSTYRTGKGYIRLEEATECYITAQQAASNMQAASDYLTAETRAFIATGDTSRAANFFEETESARRRDHGLVDIEEILGSRSA